MARLKTCQEYEATKRISKVIEWSLAIFIILLVGFFSVGCGDNPIAPITQERQNQVAPDQTLLLMAKFANARELNVALVGETYLLSSEAMSKLEQLRVLYPEIKISFIRYSVYGAPPKWKDEQRLYENLAREGGWAAAENPEGFVFWGLGRTPIFIGLAAPMEVLIFTIDNL